MKFASIPGHTTLKNKLANSIKENRFPHAVLFCSELGVGSLPMALAVACMLNCEQPSDNDSCGNCLSCQKIKKLIHPDVHFCYPVIGKKAGEIPMSKDFIAEWRAQCEESKFFDLEQWMAKINPDGSNKQPNITVKECHQIIDRLNLKAFEGKFKVQIIWKPEFLKEASNVLLKIIEEPPKNTIFLLLAEQKDQLLNTILSRTQTIRLNKIPTLDLSTSLQQLLNIEEEQAVNLARLSAGNYNEAVKKWQNDENPYLDIMHAWLKALASERAADKLKCMQLGDDLAVIGRENQKNILRYALFLMQESLKLNFGLDADLGNEALTIGKLLTQKLSIQGLESIVEHINGMIYHIERNANAKVLFLNSSVELSKSFAIYKPTLI